MHGLSPDTDLSELIDGALTFVGFGQYQLNLAFSGAVDCAITIEGDYVVIPPGGDPITFSEAVAGAAEVLHILGCTVTGADIPADGTVRLNFNDGSVIEILDSEAHYESYQVNLGDRLLVI